MIDVWSIDPEQSLLNDLFYRWGRFSQKELRGLRSNDELVVAIVAKYGIDEEIVRKHVETLLDGRAI